MVSECEGSMLRIVQFCFEQKSLSCGIYRGYSIGKDYYATYVGGVKID
jgi:hypothetical protein